MLSLSLKRLTLKSYIGTAAQVCRSSSQFAAFGQEESFLETNNVPVPEVPTLTAHEYKTTHQINIRSMKGHAVPEFTPMMSFESTPFGQKIQRVLRSEGYHAPTPTQAQSWPIAIEKRDIISVARTGSGKTCGFLLPALHDLLENKPPAGSAPPANRWSKREVRHSSVPRVLVLAPTRELSVQISTEAEKYAKACGMNSACLYGGTSRGPQISQLKSGVDIVVATPGRCNDLADMGYLDLSQIKYFVLDEADRMLDMGFEPQIRQIISQMPEDRQSLFFTATWPKEVQTLAKEFLTNPVHIEIGDQDCLNANKAITQHVMVVKDSEKEEALFGILASMHEANGTEPASVPKTIIFRSRKAECDGLADYLYSLGYAVDSLHGDKSQHVRDTVMNRFRSSRLRVLVATDVAARGLDIKDIDTVINYDFPVGSSAVEDYVHRIGRTARGSSTGNAYTLLTQHDRGSARDLIDLLQRCEQEVPSKLKALVTSGYGGRGSNSSGRGGGGGGGGGGWKGNSSGGRNGGGGGGGGGGSGWGNQRANGYRSDRAEQAFDRFNQSSGSSRGGPYGSSPARKSLLDLGGDDSWESDRRGGSSSRSSSNDRYGGRGRDE